jgi:CheY-like chemotaxis protein
VLIVEDESSIRETTAEILRGEGYGTSQAADGIEALGRLRNEVIDVVILDLRLPNMSGEAVLEALDILPPVIVVSAFEYFNEDEVREQFASKVFAVLTKPVSPQRLLSVVADAVRGPATG